MTRVVIAYLELDDEGHVLFRLPAGKTIGARDVAVVSAAMTGLEDAVKAALQAERQPATKGGTR